MAKPENRIQNHQTSSSDEEGEKKMNKLHNSPVDGDLQITLQ